MGMSDEEFYRIYGRLPHRKKKKKIYWGRIIIALIILIGIITGIVKLVGAIVNKIKGDNEAQKASKDNTSSVVVQETEDSVAEQPDNGHKYSNVQLIVCIDAGHGDYDGGATDPTGTRMEKDDTLRMALKVKENLEACGVRVVMTRESDVFVDLEDICTIANNANADFFVSIHRNSYDGDIYGVESWINNDGPKEDEALARNILYNLEQVGISDNRGVQYGYVGDTTSNYWVNADTVMPSTLLELGYITSPKDNQLFDQNFDGYAEGICNAVIETGIELGVIESDGTRILNTPLISKDKYINRIHSDNDSTGNVYYSDDPVYIADTEGDSGYVDDNGYGLETTEPSVTPAGDGYYDQYD